MVVLRSGQYIIVRIPHLDIGNCLGVHYVGIQCSDSRLTTRKYSNMSLGNIYIRNYILYGNFRKEEVDDQSLQTPAKILISCDH